MLTSAQASTLKTAIQGDSSVAASVTARNANSIAANYNGTSSPAVSIWIPELTTDAMTAAINLTDWNAITSAEQQYLSLMSQRGYIDATQSGIRSAFATIFSGKTSLTTLTTAAQRTATKLEALFTTGGVSELTGYALSPQDVASAMGW